MSLRQSLLVAMQTMISNGCGASVGLEAGYAQIGAGVASYLGVRSRLRRQDLRVLVGCGAGGAIAAAFGAPLTGAFYAFELIIGAYSLANAIPVFAATLAASLTTQAIIGAPYHITAPTVAALTFVDYGALIGLGLVAAAVGVAAMRVAALIERAFRWAIPSRLFRPVVGGVMVGWMALYSPQVLGAGHGALGLDFYWPMTATELATLMVLKLFACLVSLASGFRGGMFFASLFVGSLLGKLYSVGVDAVAPSMGLETTACVLVGMAGPFGMIYAHDIRDWAQRQTACHDLHAHRRPFFTDAFWQMHCAVALRNPPLFVIEPSIGNDRFYKFVDRTWMLQQLPLAILFFVLGGWSWVVWGIAVRISVSLTGHWLVGHFAHRGGDQGWCVDGVAMQGFNLPRFGLVTFGESFHGNHHAFPESARLGLERGQIDLGWEFVRLLRALGLAWNVQVPAELPPRPGISPVHARSLSVCAPGQAKISEVRS